jgi:Domain of unknown function (DUF4340)
MNFKTTLLLLVLVGAGTALFYVAPKSSSLPVAAGPEAFFHATAPAPSDRGTRTALEKIKPGDLTRIEMRRGDRTTILTREHGVWSMPGHWAARAAEVHALTELLTDLHTRFEPIPLSDDTDLTPFGLQREPLAVKLETENAKYHFLVGEAPETADADQFARPTYLRLLNSPGVEKPAQEIVRLGPGLLALLDRPSEYYLQRRLFPSERVPKENEPGVKVTRLVAQSVHIEENKPASGEDGLALGQGLLTLPQREAFTLERKDKTWELSAPARDRLEPRAAEALLTALPDLWAERFVDLDYAVVGAALSGDDSFGGTLTALGWLALTTPDKSPQWLKVKAGLTTPERKIVVTRENGDRVALLIGKTGRSTTKTVMRAPPPGMPVPPREEKITEEFRYAKLEDNPRIFEIKGDMLKDVFVSLDTLRDARLARFEPAEARELEIVQPDGKESVQLVKEKDRWKLVQPLKAEADAEKVRELLTKLSGLEARGPDVIDKPDPAAQGFDKPGTTIVVKWETEKKAPDGTTTKTPHHATLKFGKNDKEKKKLYVKADDWLRINAVDDSLVSLIERPALAYRGKRLLNFTAEDVAKLDVRRGKQSLTLKQDKEGWKLVAPVETKVDGGKVHQLADALGRLEVLDYVNDEPAKEQLDSLYGLGETAALVVTVTFKDASKPARTLRLGKARDMKPSFFGKLDDGASVFVVDANLHAQLDRDSLAYLPAELWQMPPDKVAGVRIKKEGQDEVALKRDGQKWQITAPFDAPAQPVLAEQMAHALAAVRCESHTVHEAKELGAYGLDNPALTFLVTDTDGNQHTLLLGKPVEKDNGSRYAKLADQPGVCVIGPQLVAAADRPALELLDPSLLRLAPAKVERITTKSGDRTLTLERKGDDWQVLNAPGSPFSADKDAMSDKQFPWANLNAVKFADYGGKVDWAKYGLDKPEVVVTITVKDDAKEHTIELGKHVADQNSPRYARVDHGQGVALLAGNVSQTLARSYLDYVNHKVLHFKADEVTQLERQMGTEKLEIARTGDGWKLVKPAEFRADDKMLQELLAQLADLTALRVAAYPLTELKSNGLDQPAATVTIKLKGDAQSSEYVVKLGNPVDAVSPERYALIGDSKAVVVLPETVSKRLVAAPIAYRDHSLAHFADADKVRLERGTRQAVFARVAGSWKLTEPITADADNDELDDFMNTLAKLRADELVAEKPTAEELKSYGLDKPAERLKLLAGDTEVLNLLIGGREKGGIRRYAQLGGKDIVFLLDRHLSVRCLGEFRTRTVWPTPLDAAQVDSIHYAYAQKPFVLERTETGNWQVEGKPDIKPNTATATETLDALARLKVSRYAVDKDANFKEYGLEPPDLVLEITSRTGKRTLHIGRQEGDSKGLYARIPDPNRSDVFVIDAADAAKILRNVEAFTKAPERPTLPIPAASMP